MTNYDYRIIPAVVKTKSFSKAAKILGISQPAISNKVQALEDKYNIKIFERTPQGVLLTDAGNILYNYSLDFLTLHEKMEKELNRFITNNEKTLTIGASCTVGSYVMPYSISKFKMNHPDINIKLQTNNLEETMVSLEEGRVNLTIICATKQVLDNPTLEIHRLGSKPLLLIVPQNSTWRKKESITIKELKKLPLIIREPGAAIRAIWEDYLQNNGYNLSEFNIVSQLGSMDAVKLAVESGLGVTLVPSVAVEKEIALNRLKTIKISDFDMEVVFCLVYKKNQILNPATKSFIKFLKNEENNPFAWS